MGNYGSRNSKDNVLNDFMKTKEDVDVDIRLRKALLMQILLGLVKIGAKLDQTPMYNQT